MPERGNRCQLQEPSATKERNLELMNHTHRSSFVSALSESSSTDAGVIPPAASRAEAKNSIFMEMDGIMH